MLNKFASLVLVVALVSTLGGSSVIANSPTNPADAKSKVQPNEKLKADMASLVADAKAGKFAPAERPQIQPARSNNLSKGKKIAIGVSIAVAVIAVIFVVKSPILNDGR